MFKGLLILFIWVCCSYLQTHQKRASDPITDGCEPPCGCWELNSGPLEEQSVLLTAEPSLQPINSFNIWMYMCIFKEWYITWLPCDFFKRSLGSSIPPLISAYPFHSFQHLILDSRWSNPDSEKQMWHFFLSLLGVRLESYVNVCLPIIKIGKLIKDHGQWKGALKSKRQRMWCGERQWYKGAEGCCKCCCASSDEGMRWEPHPRCVNTWAENEVYFFLLTIPRYRPRSF